MRSHLFGAILFLRAVYFILGAVRADADVPAQLANLCERLRILWWCATLGPMRDIIRSQPVYTIRVLRPVAGIYLKNKSGR